jgi:hypothetical protein
MTGLITKQFYFSNQHLTTTTIVSYINHEKIVLSSVSLAKSLISDRATNFLKISFHGLQSEISNFRVINFCESWWTIQVYRCSLSSRREDYRTRSFLSIERRHVGHCDIVFSDALIGQNAAHLGLAGLTSRKCSRRLSVSPMHGLPEIAFHVLASCQEDTWVNTWVCNA